MVRHLDMIFEDQFCNGGRSFICCDLDVTRTTGSPIETTDVNIPSRTSFEEHPNYVHFKSKTCGEIPNVLRISHGKRARIFEFAFSALIGYESTKLDEYDFSCGGSLISGKF